MATAKEIPGYTYGTEAVPRSPVTMEEFERMKETALFGEEDIKYLQMSYEVVKDHTEEILDQWYGFVGDNPHLLASFTRKSDGEPISGYLNDVRKRFGQWILDTARANYDQEWLDYQYEIGLRHHRSKKNETDGVESTDNIPFRYLFPLVFPITYTLKPFLAKKGHSDEEVQKMYEAWVKSCMLQVTLWSYPYVKEGDF